MLLAPTEEEDSDLRLSVSSDGSCGMLRITFRLRIRTLFLSVSSDGSCGMLLESNLFEFIREDLSVSSDGSCGMLPLSAGKYISLGGPFSILRRIVWNATWRWSPRTLGRGNFQYPRTDRVECY